MNELHHEWDDSLDQVLSAYANVTPRPGLEARILASAAAAQPARWPLRLWAPLATAIAACLVAAMLHLAAPHKTAPPEAAAKIPAQLASPAPRAALPATAVAALPIPSHRSVAHREANRQTPSDNSEFAETFPAATPLTPEEQRMEQLAQNSRVRFSPSQPEIQISALEITPLPDPPPIDRSQP